LRDRGIDLPLTPSSVTNSVPAKRAGFLAVTAGHVPVIPTGQYIGQLGMERTVEEDHAAATKALVGTRAASTMLTSNR
jgi:hypothetical protein